MTSSRRNSAQGSPRPARQGCGDLAPALPAAVRRRHEPRQIAGATKARHSNAERAVPSPDRGHAAFDSLERRFPEQRSTAEQPDIARRSVGKHVPNRNLVILIGKVGGAGLGPASSTTRAMLAMRSAVSAICRRGVDAALLPSPTRGDRGRRCSWADDYFHHFCWITRWITTGLERPAGTRQSMPTAGSLAVFADRSIDEAQPGSHS